MISLAQEIIDLSFSQSKIILTPIPSDDPKLREPDISNAQALLDWYPSTSRINGLKKTIEYFERVLTEEI